MDLFEKVEKLVQKTGCSYEDAKLALELTDGELATTSEQTAGKGGSLTVPRSDYRLVQTPQTFDIQLLKAANRQPYNDSFTDDASVVESYGHGITLVPGNRENIKITTPFDLTIAEALLAENSA